MSRGAVAGGALVLAALVASGVLLAGAVAGGAPAAPAPAHDPVEVVLAPGDTLWDVAVHHAPPGTDPRAYLAALRQHNGVGPALPAWAVLELPPAMP